MRARPVLVLVLALAFAFAASLARARREARRPRPAGPMRFACLALRVFLAGAALLGGARGAWAQAAGTYPQPGSGASFARLALTCAPAVDRVTLAALVRTESGYNPYAIGVVGGHLARQPRNRAEALATVAELERLGYDFSLGLSQVNRRNFARLGETAATMFDPCRNLRAGATILRQCFVQAARRWPDQQVALRAALSCYYSGNFSTGFAAGYVQRVVAGAALAAPGAVPIPVVPDAGLPPAMNAHAAPRRGMRHQRAGASRIDPVCHGRPKVWITCASGRGALCVRCLAAR
jgi:type IV secretion system protein VirB1